MEIAVTAMVADRIVVSEFAWPGAARKGRVVRTLWRRFVSLWARYWRTIRQDLPAQAPEAQRPPYEPGSGRRPPGPWCFPWPEERRHR
jgi:hypothetical protein